ncbi:hypothetical protein GGS24DRAFT_325175 [Hypoxylon argillaceum]|nr:hypothetical protein GGS24DRAFT_325175 [Hypoxylon argillaceum]
MHVRNRKLNRVVRRVYTYTYIVYTHTHIHTYIHTYIHIHIHTYILTDLHTRTVPSRQMGMFPFPLYLALGSRSSEAQNSNAILHRLLPPPDNRRPCA